MRYICEVWVDQDGRGERRPGEWLPVDGMPWGTRDQAIDVALEWEREGYITRIRNNMEDY